MFQRVNDLKIGEIAREPFAVAGDERPAPHIGLGTDEEIGEDGSLLPTSAAVLGKGRARPMAFWQGQAFDLNVESIVRK